MDRLQIRKLPGLSISSAQAAGDHVPTGGDEFFILESPPCPRPKTPRKKEEAGHSVSRKRHNPASPTPSSSFTPMFTAPASGHTYSPGYTPSSPTYSSDTSVPMSPGSPGHQMGYSPVSPLYGGHTYSPGYSPASLTYSSDTSYFSDTYRYTPPTPPLQNNRRNEDVPILISDSESILISDSESILISDSESILISDSESILISDSESDMSSSDLEENDEVQVSSESSDSGSDSNYWDPWIEALFLDEE